MHAKRLALLATVIACVCCSAFVGLCSASASGSALLTGAGPSAPVPSVGETSLESPFPRGAAPSPEEAASDIRSRTRFIGLSQDEAIALARETFAVGRPSWTPPGTEQGTSITKYIGDHSARETLPNGKHAVVTSTVPLRADGKAGLAPVSLALKAEGESYAPANPLVPIAIPKHIAQGISFSASGISVVPSSTQAGETPETIGGSVAYANSAPDTDLLVEPVPAGAEVSWQLRSQRSPQDNSLTFNLPAGASLRSSTVVPGAAEVVVEGQPTLAIPPATAHTADGKSIATSYSISGNTLTTHVDLSGEVDFPVLVDPLIVGDSGTMNGANVWNAWHSTDNCGGCFASLVFYNLIQIGTNPGPPDGDFGEWYIFAPGAGAPGGAGITRVDLAGVIHEATNQSVIQAGIQSSNGGSPVYSLNGYAGATGPSPLNTYTAYANQSMAFCAQSAGGHDGGEQPLCDENYSGGDFYIADMLGGSQSVFNYIRVGGAAITYLDTTNPNVVEWIGRSDKDSAWEQYGPSTDYIFATDQGLGIQRYELQLPPGNSPTFREESSCSAPNGFTGCPFSERSQNIELHSLATGIYELGAVAVDAAGNATLEKPYPKLYIDHTQPSTPALSGPLTEFANSTIGNGNYLLRFNAVDGSTTSPQSGVKSFEVKVDGRPSYTEQTSCAAPTGVPTSECFELAGEWRMNGQKYGAGSHVVSVIAKDWAGNTSTQSLNVTVNEAASEPLGPGTVNLGTGDYTLSATDVSVAAGTATLSLSRTADSRDPSSGANGPLGPGWALSLPAGANSRWQSLTPLSGGSVSVNAVNGEQIIFSPKAGGGWVSPAGFQTDTMTEPSSGVYQITDAAGNYTKFTQPGTEAVYAPSTVAEASATGGLNKVTYSFTKTAGGIVEPTEILGPEPSEGACTATLVKGCRALTFNYATSTTATGEGRNQWGDYAGRLTRAYFTAWDSSQNKMSEAITVAQYAYDLQGRLRAEWDPRISPALKTSYGYDAAGRVTALTPPGQQTWAFHYGSAAGDEGEEGRLLSVARPSASTELWGGEAPKNTTLPTLSGSATVGTKMTIVRGTWSGNPVSYSYQWLSCWAGSCFVIQGATNASYTPETAGVRVVARVTATNGGGSVTAETAQSAIIGEGAGTEGAPPPAPEAHWTLEYGVPVNGTGLPEMKKTSSWLQTDAPVNATAIFPPDESQGWPASDYKRATLYYLDALGRNVNVATPSGGISTSEFDESNNLIRTLSPDGREKALEHKKLAEELDTKYTYSEDGTRLESTLGPQHTVKLANGSEVQARKRTRYYYDEGAPGGGPYRLVTKTTEAALVGGEEKDVRTVKSSYSGQEGLGWKLHAPTSSTADPGGLNLVHKTTYDPHTGNVLEDSSPAASSEAIYPPAFATSFGSEGAGNGQLKHPEGATFDTSGNLWVADEKNNRIEKFSQSGGFLAAYGSEGSGNGQFRKPFDVAYSPTTGLLYVADTENNRIEEINPSNGAYVGVLGTSGEGTLNEPIGLTVGSTGELFVTDWGHNRVVEFSSEGTFLRQIGSAGSGNGQLSGPSGIVLSEGSLYVVDRGNDRIEQFSSAGAYLGQFGSKGSGNGQFEYPAWIAANPSTGNLYVSDTFNYRMQEFSPAGRFLTLWATWGARHELSYPTGVAINSAGRLFIADMEGDRITTWAPPEAGAARLSYGSTIGSHGSGNGQFSVPIDAAFDGAGNLWVTDLANNRVEKFSPKGSFLAVYGSYGSGNGQFNGPGGIDINQSAGNVYIADTYNARIEELSSSGAFVRSFGTEGAGKLTKPGSLAIDSSGDVWVPDMSADKVFEYSATGAYIASYGKEGSGELQFNKPISIAFSGENLYVADSANHRVEELSNKGAFVRTFAIEGGGSGELYDPEGIASDAAGNLYVVDYAEAHVEEFNSSGAYMATFATKGSGEGQLTNPVGAAIDAAGDLYVVDTEGNRVEKWNAVDQAAHDTKTIYYSSGENKEFSTCGNHAEWAGLPCLAKPAQQPLARALANLPETTYTYNIWDEPVATVDTVGSTTRTTTIGYDGAGRVKTQAISSSIDTPLPTITNAYSETTGALIEQSTPTKTIKRKYNTLGQLTAYTDADGTESTYSYDLDGRIEKTTDGKGTQTYGYDSTTGMVTSLTDSAAGTFTGVYDSEGLVTSEGYPNGMSAKYTYDATDQPTNLEYVKTTHCSSECTWYSDHVVPSIEAQWRSQTSTASKESYAYDGGGRLTEVQETPTGKGCTTRLYGVDEDGNRTSLTTRPPGAEGNCASEGGTIERHIYDEGDRLIDEGVTYDEFGNTTSLPSSDAGGHTLTSTYYSDGTLASQDQNGQAISYGLDPARRTREAVSTGTASSTVISHYAGVGDAPSWTVDNTGKWTRYIGGIGGGLAAVQINGGTPTLRLANLHGDIVGEAALSETEPKLLSSTETTEYGVPVGKPERYAWLGGSQRATELPSGIVAMGARTYVPQLGRFEQADPQPGGGASSYSYTSGDPVNSADPSGEWTTTVTYNYEVAQTGTAQEGLTEHFIVPGAIMPPPVNLQLEEEFNANPPWNAVSALAASEEAPSAIVPHGLHAIAASAGCPASAKCYGRPPSKSETEAKRRNSHRSKSCPKGYILLPIINKCATIDFPPIPPPLVPGPGPEPVPVP